MFTALFLIAAPIDIPKPAPTKPDEPLAKKFSVDEGRGVSRRRRRRLDPRPQVHHLPHQHAVPDRATASAGRRWLEGSPRVPRKGCEVVVERRQAARRCVTSWSLPSRWRSTTPRKPASSTPRPMPRSTGCGTCSRRPANGTGSSATGRRSNTTTTTVRPSRRWRSAIAPDGYAKTDKAKAGIEKLTAYFEKTPAPDLHHTAMLLWASTKIDGLMTADEQKKTIAALRGEAAQGRRLVPALARQLQASRRGQDAQRPQRRERRLRHRLRHLRAPASRREANDPADHQRR